MTAREENRRWPMLLAATGYLVVAALLFRSVLLVLFS